MRIVGLTVIAALLLLSSAASPARANLADPRCSNVWGLDFGGTYYFHGSEFPAAWMKSAIDRANATIGHGDARNPDFHVTTSTSANGVVHFMSSATNQCDGELDWKGCADAYANRTFRLWLASTSAGPTARTAPVVAPATTSRPWLSTRWATSTASGTT